MTLELLPGRQAGRGGRSKSETEYRSSCEEGGRGDKNKRLDAADRRRRETARFHPELREVSRRRLADAADVDCG